MKAWLLDNLTGIDHLRLAEIPDPPPAPGEVLLDVLYAALNPADRYLAEAQYPARPTFPHILGRDGAGIAPALGPHGTGINVGEKYSILRGEAGINRPGTFAENVIVPAEWLGPMPPGWTLPHSPSAARVYVPAEQALPQWGNLPTPSIALITGASGGVGVASIHLAAALG